MGRKRKRFTPHALNRVFCYYCDRTFQNEHELLMHQREKHLRCPSCSKRMLSVPSLMIHASQMHNVSLSVVPNAIPGRDKIDLDVLGMQGIPEEYYDKVQAQKKRVLDPNYRSNSYLNLKPTTPMPAPSHSPPLLHSNASLSDLPNGTFATHLPLPHSSSLTIPQLQPFKFPADNTIGYLGYGSNVYSSNPHVYSYLHQPFGSEGNASRYPQTQLFSGELSASSVPTFNMQRSGVSFSSSVPGIAAPPADCPITCIRPDARARDHASFRPLHQAVYLPASRSISNPVNRSAVHGPAGSPVVEHLSELRLVFASIDTSAEEFRARMT